MLMLCSCGCRTEISESKRFAHGHNRRRLLAERFWEKVEKTDSCWLWRGTINPNGYGLIQMRPLKSPQKAHRIAYVLSYGALPDNKEVCHSCDNPSCVRPDHLFLGSHTDNMRDAKSKNHGLWKPGVVFAKGEKIASHKLTESNIKAIRASNKPYAQLAIQYGVSATTVERASKRITWRHVT